MDKKIIKIALCIAALYFAGCSFEHRQSDDMGDMFNAYNWQLFVGSSTGIWISVGQQEVFLINNKQVVKEYPCSTAAAGVGNKKDSGKTPLGWHRVGEKLGNALPAGAILKDRQWTGDVWAKGQHADKDLILSRVLWLEGLEKNKNLGGDVDSHDRYIYIHGTNRIEELGRPASAGCIRMDPQDIIDLYERVDEGCCVWITRD